MPTKKLYDLDAYETEFSAEVLSCTAENDGYAVILDRTLFFPEEGGQACDTGRLGGIPVLCVRLEGDGTITHLLPSPLPVGETVKGEIDFAPRFRKMQHHTGEHILSGLAHRLYGAENVGFHLGDTDVTMDLDVSLDRYALDRIEDLANEAIYKNLPVSARYLTKDEIKTAVYRSKLDLTENVRVVTVQDYDDCACCAPHVARTGEIGVIKILDFMRYKGGVRLHIACGADALRDYRTRYAQAVAISNLLSAKQEEIVEAVEQLQSTLVEEKRAQNSLRRNILEEELKRLPDAPVAGNLAVFSPLLEARQLRELVNAGVTRCSGIFAAFAGSDESGYTYVMGSKTVDLRSSSKEINTALSGRGGGSEEMIQGSAGASEKEIRAYLEGEA
ncbi:MAG: alanyl-tRNA editing protein [Clostridia bacterium]|nr:alanyl-tRNA editing protein [Clostridia bacterium]